MLRRRLGPMVLAGLLFTGCSMLVQEPSQPVQVSSTPAGAMVTVNGQVQAETTPLTLTLDPRRTHALRLEKACYARADVSLQPVMGVRSFGTLSVPVNQLPPTVHVELPSTCAVHRQPETKS